MYDEFDNFYKENKLPKVMDDIVLIKIEDSWSGEHIFKIIYKNLAREIAFDDHQWYWFGKCLEKHQKDFSVGGWGYDFELLNGNSVMFQKRIGLNHLVKDAGAARDFFDDVIKLVRLETLKKISGD